MLIFPKHPRRTQDLGLVLGKVAAGAFEARVRQLIVDGRLPVLAVAGQVGVGRPSVWRWQQRFAEAGVDGLLRDKTRKPGKAPLSAETVAKILALPPDDWPERFTFPELRAKNRRVNITLIGDGT